MTKAPRGRPKKRRVFVLVLGTCVLLLATAVAIALMAPASEGCVEGPGSTTLCAASDMARLPNHGRVPLESPDYDLSQGGLRLNGASNEVLGFQIIFKGSKADPGRFTLDVTDLKSAQGHLIPAVTHIDRFLGRYTYVGDGGYTWGPTTKVLEWPDFYADALIPFDTLCGERTPFLKDFAVPSKHGGNQSIWVDVYIPDDQPPGLYTGKIAVGRQGSDEETTIPLSVQVWGAKLPNKPTVQAVGELYDPYRYEGASKFDTDAWRRTAHCYHQMAHRHRVVFIERFDGVVGPTPGNPQGSWDAYKKAFGPVLDGSLFTKARGYVGPGAGVGVTAWRTPWPQGYNGSIEGPLPKADLDRWGALAAAWGKIAEAEGWTPETTFAYIFDEVDGPTDQGADAPAPKEAHKRVAYIEMVHEQMKLVQQALDKGSPKHRIDLVWTSHSNPAIWKGKPGQDLTGSVRLWVPNAGAADVAFLTERAEAGETVWFYHEGHPYIGAHSINVSGIDMRTWGVVTARYGLDGHFMWAVNLGDPENPYNKPSYKGGDDRFGNGTMVYPGALLPTIEHQKLVGPVPSARLKAWRRGLQDAELIALAKKKAGAKVVDALVEGIVPKALSEGSGPAAWSEDPAEWHVFHQELLRLASGQ